MGDLNTARGRVDQLDILKVNGNSVVNLSVFYDSEGPYSMVELFVVGSEFGIKYYRSLHHAVCVLLDIGA